MEGPVSPHQIGAQFVTTFWGVSNKLEMCVKRCSPFEQSGAYKCGTEILTTRSCFYFSIVG